MRILIVEDNAPVALSMKTTLEKVGHNVVRLAPDTESALAAAARLPIDLALVDYWLAGGSCGMDVARALRSRYWVPSIFISASPENCRKGREETGALGCLPKPFTEEVLIKTLEIVEVLMAGGSPPQRCEPFEVYH